jgi:hypothetical protein
MARRIVRFADTAQKIVLTKLMIAVYMFVFLDYLPICAPIESSQVHIPKNLDNKTLTD